MKIKALIAAVAVAAAVLVPAVADAHHTTPGSWYLWDQASGYGPGGEFGYGRQYEQYNGIDYYVGGWGQVRQATSGSNRFTCSELWLDHNHVTGTNHRSADVYVTCNQDFTSGAPIDALHNSGSGGPDLNSPLYNWQSPDISRIYICRTDIRNFNRTAGSNCTIVGNNGTLSTDVQGVRWAALPGINTANEPEIIRGNMSRLQFGNHTLRAANEDIVTNGVYKGVMQSDGNFVVYNVHETDYYWHTGTTTASKAVMQTDGNFVLYTSSGSPVFATSWCGAPNVSGAWLRVVTDRVQLMHPNGSLLWQSRNDKQPGC